MKANTTSRGSLSSFEIAGIEFVYKKASGERVEVSKESLKELGRLSLTELKRVNKEAWKLKDYADKKLDEVKKQKYEERDYKLEYKMKVIKELTSLVIKVSYAKIAARNDGT